MPRRAGVYEIVDAGSGEVLARHRTRQAAIDGWRSQWTGRAVRIERRGVPDHHVVVVEGTWHEATGRLGASCRLEGKVPTDHDLPTWIITVEHALVEA